MRHHYCKPFGSAKINQYDGFLGFGYYSALQYATHNRANPDSEAELIRLINQTASSLDELRREVAEEERNHWKKQQPLTNLDGAGEEKIGAFPCIALLIGKSSEPVSNQY